MLIRLSPQRRDDALALSMAGDVLTINGEEFDFSVIPDGAELPSEAVASEWVCGPVKRINGQIELTLILPHGPNPPHEVAFPLPVLATTNGEIALPGASE